MSVSKWRFCNSFLSQNVVYGLLYEDLTTRWHETTSWYDADKVWRVKSYGPIRWWEVGSLPNEVASKRRW